MPIYCSGSGISCELGSYRIAEIARNLSESGCMSCGVGIESVDNNSLKTMNKHLTFEQIERGCKLLMDNNIEICGQFIIGNIGDTLETVKKSVMS